MSDLKLDLSTNDLVIERSDLVLVEQRENLQQFLKQRLQMFRGEWFLNALKGVPYYQEILTKAPNFAAVDSILKREILQTSGIIELEKFELDYDETTRALTLAFTAKSTDGVIEFNEDITI